MSLNKPVRAPLWTGEEPCRVAPDVFHPGPGDGRAIATAKWICRLCPMQAPCLEWAMSDPALTGIHAGTTDRQRRQLRGARLRERAQ